MAYPETFKGFGVTDTNNWSKTDLIRYQPKPFGEHDVDVKIISCGICGSDIHTATGSWGPLSVTPCIPGHEIVGTIVKKGSKVSTLEVGDRVGVGAQVWACLDCKVCKSGEDTYCPHRVHTYNQKYSDGSITNGGYAQYIRAHEHFAFKIPDSIASEEASPLLCAGITVFSPLKRNGCGPGKKVGIVGIGGLGHLAIQLANAMGAEVYAFSRSEKKKSDAIKLGAHHYIETGKPNWNENLLMELDLVLCTANANENFDLESYLKTLKIRGKWVSVGLPDEPFLVSPRVFMSNACFMGASHLGSHYEMKELFELVVEKNVRPWIERLSISQENVKEGMERCHENRTRYRVVLTDYDQAFEQ